MIAAVVETPTEGAEQVWHGLPACLTTSRCASAGREEAAEIYSMGPSSYFVLETCLLVAIWPLTTW
jgi:hypothetical protein